jgi:hypothetical protein
LPESLWEVELGWRFQNAEAGLPREPACECPKHCEIGVNDHLMERIQKHTFIDPLFPFSMKPFLLRPISPCVGTFTKFLQKHKRGKKNTVYE